MTFEEEYKKQINQAKQAYGDDYTHYINTAKTLYEKKADAALITAALFHGVKFYEIPQQSNYKVDQEARELVHHFQQHFIKQENNEFKSNLEDVTLNPKIFLLRLIDQRERITNPKTNTQQKNNAAERTLKIYAPIAELLGMHQMANEMINKAFQIKEPKQYDKIKKFIQKQNFEEKMHVIRNEINEKLTSDGINFQIESRVKSPASIFYKKREVKDYIGMRIIVEKNEEIEKAKKIVKQIGETIEEKDYIKNQKPNGYQSLHLTMKKKDGTPFEVQIRTKKMHEEIQENENIKHAFYKSGLNRQLDPKIEVAKKAIVLYDQNKEKEAMQLIDESNKYDLINIKVNAEGKIHELNLPKNSTILDAAYNTPKQKNQSIHLGHYVQGGIINNKNAGKETTLKNNDEVTLILAKKPQKHSPSLSRTVTTTNAIQGLKENALLKYR